MLQLQIIITTLKTLQHYNGTTTSPETGPIGEALLELTENHAMPSCFLFSNSVESVFLKASQVHETSLKAVATVSTDCYRPLLPVRFSSLWARWGFSALAYSRTGYRGSQPIQLFQCWVVENVHKIYAFLCNSKQWSWWTRNTNYKALSEHSNHTVLAESEFK